MQYLTDPHMQPLNGLGPPSAGMPVGDSDWMSPALAVPLYRRRTASWPSRNEGQPPGIFLLRDK